MSINSIYTKLGTIGSIDNAFTQEGVKKIEDKKEGKNAFGDMLVNAIKEVNGLQVKADIQIEGLATGKEGVTTHGEMLALEKADIAFQLMNTVRSKIIRVYEEVMRTQV